jgi:hypothetical protein
VSALAELAEAVDPSLRPYAVPDPPGDRFQGGDYAFVLEAVYEGFLLHYGKPRAFAGMDSDLRLLAGDALYALGLERLAQAGDLDAVAELSDLISLCARAAAEGREELVEPLWAATARRLAGDGPGARAEVAPKLAQQHRFSA